MINLHVNVKTRMEKGTQQKRIAVRNKCTEDKMLASADLQLVFKTFLSAVYLMTYTHHGSVTSS
jgi:hypothetical protein